MRSDLILGTVHPRILTATASLVLACLLMPACATRDSQLTGPLERFHRYVEQRKKNPRYADSTVLDGLDFRIGGEQYIKRDSRIDRKLRANLLLGPDSPPDGDSISVFEAGKPDGPFIVVWVTPRVSGTFLDPAEPSEEFLREMHESTRQALLEHRILYIQEVDPAAKTENRRP